MREPPMRPMPTTATFTLITIRCRECRSWSGGRH
jgi:hypothetical protein